MPLSSAQAEARPGLALSTLDLVSPSQVQCLESLLAPVTSAGKKKKINPLTRSSKPWEK